jgi:hypothetical protein
MTADEFREALGLPPATALVEQAEVAAPPGVIRSDEIWPWVMWMLLAVLAMETLLASRVVE